MRITKAVITAAARGVRLYPVADTVQKSMLPIVDKDGLYKPVIQIIAEEAFESGIEEICLICAPGDEHRYTEGFEALYKNLLETHKNSDWAVAQAGKIKHLLERMSFVVQKEPRGYGHAVLQACDWVGDNSFLLLLGDYVYVSQIAGKRCAQQLIDLALQEQCSVAAVSRTPESAISKYGTLTGKAIQNISGAYKIEKIIEKPSVSQAELELYTPGLRAGNYLCFFGMHVFKPSLFDVMKDELNKNKNADNIALTPALQILANSDKYLALEVKGNRYDLSKKLGLWEAQLALGLTGKSKNEMLDKLIEVMADNARIQNA